MGGNRVNIVLNCVRKEENSEIYQLKLDGKAIRDLAYILLPKLQADANFNMLFGSIFETGIDYIYFMGDNQNYKLHYTGNVEITKV